MPQICSKQRRGKASFALAISGKQLELTGKLQKKAEANSWYIQSSVWSCFWDIWSFAGDGQSGILSFAVVADSYISLREVAVLLRLNEETASSKCQKFESKRWRL